MKRYFAWILTLILAAGLLFGCGSQENKKESAAPKDDSFYAYQDSEYLNEKPETVTDAISSSNSITFAPEIGVGQKLVRNVYLNTETEDLDELLTQIDRRVAELGGYCENRDVYHGNAGEPRRYRQATLIVRIPAHLLDSFTTLVSDSSNVTSIKETAEDITLTYITTESRVNALQTEHDRLLELLAKAETMSDLLEIESRLTDVRAELEQVGSQLKLYDNMVSYGTVRLTINEVEEYTVTEEKTETFWDRISTGFMDSLKNIGTFFKELFVSAIVFLPYVLLIGLVAVIVAVVLIKKRKRKADKS